MPPEDTRYQYTSLQGKWIPVSIVLNILFNQLPFKQVKIKDSHVVWYKCIVRTAQLWRLYTFQGKKVFLSIGFLHVGASHFVIDGRDQVLQPFWNILMLNQYILKYHFLFSTGYFKTNINLCTSPIGRNKIRICSY